jgi:hypothetical protein
MKSIILFLISSTICFFQLQAQCTADAGPDKVVCNNFNGLANITLGGSPSAISGTPPFTYSWETSYTITVGSFSHTYFASDFLDDTTSANPAFVLIQGDSLNFILTVTDTNNNSCSDTVFVRVSHFYQHLWTISFTNQQGDSVFIDFGTNVTSSNPPITVLWQPNHGLNDSTNFSFWSKPNSSVAYYNIITDELGCVQAGAPWIFIHVLPVSVEELNNLNVDIYPNPATDFIKIRKKKNDKLTFHLYNIEGKLIRKFSLDKGLEEIKLTPELDSGFYFYKIVDEKESAVSGKLIKL